MKWIYNNWLNLLAVYFGYGLFWYFGWQLSVNFETITHITSWFLPAGVRVASLVLFNKKYWPVIVLAEFTAIFMVNSREEPFVTIIGEIIATLAPILIYMFFIDQYLKSFKTTRFDSLQHLIKLFISISLATITTAVILVVSLAYQGIIAEDELIITILAFILGDFVGILFLLPMVFVVRDFLTKQEKFEPFTIDEILFISFSMVFLMFFIQQNLIYYIKFFTFIPIIMFAYKKGWKGAALTIFVVNLIIIAASFFVEDAGSIQEKQFYLIVISTTGLLLGASISEQRNLNYRRARKNAELLTSIDKNQQLSRKLINAQEDERKVISRELHDELGQNITALKLHLAVVKDMIGSSKATPIIEIIDGIANSAYQSVNNLMHWLRPAILDDMGLEKALLSNKFIRLLDNAGIQYLPTLDGNLKLLSDDLNIAIYRIAQESMNNTAKYSKAKRYWLSLKINPSNVELEIKDDGIGFNVEGNNNLDSGFGLQGIEDRVMALGGAYKLSSNSEGTTYNIIFKML